MGRPTATGRVEKVAAPGEGGRQNTRAAVRRSARRDDEDEGDEVPQAGPFVAAGPPTVVGPQTVAGPPTVAGPSSVASATMTRDTTAAADTTVSQAAPAAVTHSFSQNPYGKPARTPLPSGRITAAPTTSATSAAPAATAPAIMANVPNAFATAIAPATLAPATAGAQVAQAVAGVAAPAIPLKYAQHSTPPQPGAPIPGANVVSSHYYCTFQGCTKHFDNDRGYKRHYNVEHLGNRWYCLVAGCGWNIYEYRKADVRAHNAKENAAEVAAGRQPTHPQ
ncbi:uncharacterized protein L3040_004584 [Drepanopeziza brunnea f. sp. 'multigermtubi']|uniref:C2H2-type domain-containing protein n=1 Tax=Marssonina brunnea f. sp. multigermtubi (strain MB_m1) TaxID=1072389 RepID=K1Y6Z0_MARBU|nr:uncharacterized protein MBM_00077 [Drepanopeziza brunnea f. sp. 'multigermtubi' MB_m1]EKD20964.1 hypothetical protein MBM_00077 [Drepanopeziza brunnea f. sp. 'multigermtubi' MB_m1]KAJ5042024.1 hypothetical protein L3040_004584 [Drepanopeziza brunnea f. sp. 'multigermtubi']